MRLYVPVAAGLEAVVKRQLEKLGYTDARALNGRIVLEGEWEDVARMNVFLRSGERVLVGLGTQKVTTFDELFDFVYSLPWEDKIAADGKILIDGKSVKSKLAAIKATGGVVKKAIVKRLIAKRCPYKKALPESGARYVVGVSLYEDEATITLDTSGDGLHKRGYRSLGYSAPLKETMAAAMIDMSVFHPEKQFADLFCGSGTLPIEAALRAYNIAPGAKRDFDFLHWQNVSVKVLERAREEAADMADYSKKTEIYAADINPKAISIAEYHAKRAGVEKYIRFETRDMRSFTASEPYGVVLSNPPYGERLSDEAEIKKLYKDLGAVYSKLPDWSMYILTSFPEFERYFGKRAVKKKKLYNANLECNYYSYTGAKPPKENKENNVRASQTAKDGKNDFREEK